MLFERTGLADVQVIDDVISQLITSLLLNVLVVYVFEVLTEIPFTNHS
jgi:hypothetical protein